MARDCIVCPFWNLLGSLFIYSYHIETVKVKGQQHNFQFSPDECSQPVFVHTERMSLHAVHHSYTISPKGRTLPLLLHMKFKFSTWLIKLNGVCFLTPMQCFSFHSVICSSQKLTRVSYDSRTKPNEIVLLGRSTCWVATHRACTKW